MANSLSSPCFVTNFEYSLDPIPSHRLSSSNTGSFSPSSSCALVEGESAAVGLSSAPRKSEHALSVFCFFAERCGDKRRVVRRLLPWRHVVRGGGVPLSPSKRLVLFLWSAAGAVRPSDARSIKRQNCQSANLFIPSVRHATYHEFPTIQKLLKS